MTSTDTLTVTATHACTYLGDKSLGHQGYALHPEQPQRFELRSPEFDTREEAETWAARFPKALKLTVRSCSYADRRMTYSAASSAVLASNDVNGGVNETGLRRYRTAVRAADKLGVTIEFRAGHVVNTYADRAAFESAIA